MCESRSSYALVGLALSSQRLRVIKERRYCACRLSSFSLLHRVVPRVAAASVRSIAEGTGGRGMIPSVRRAKDPTHRWGVWRRHASARVSAIMPCTFSVAGSATTFVRARRLVFARPGFGELRRAVLVIIATSTYLRVHAGRDCCVPVLSG